MKKSELEIVREIRDKFSIPKELGIGIGDDAAFLSLKKSSLLTTDLMIEGVHFDLSYFSPYHLGFRIVSVNVSDIYAMGGDFIGFLLSLGIPKTFTEDDLFQLFSGVEKALKKYGGYLIGGDLSKADKLTLSGFAIGECEKPILRNGAEPGDKIYITAPLGLSSAGFYFLQSLTDELKAIIRDIREIGDFERLNQKFSLDLSTPIIRHLMPLARSSAKFKNQVKAMMDISDGLLIDLHRLCEESRVGAELYLEKIPIDQSVVKIGEILNREYMNFILSGGDDYELLVISDRDLNDFGLIEIGRITEEKGLFLIDPHKGKIPAKPEGWQHF